MLCQVRLRRRLEAGGCPLDSALVDEIANITINASGRPSAPLSHRLSKDELRYLERPLVRHTSTLASP